jgi:nudix-type nucleoside diphosphatase (YffH/AdpP family)
MQLLDAKTLYQGWGRFLMLTVRLSTGVVVQRQLDDHGHAAAVLPYDAERRVALLARMPRAAALFVGEDPVLMEACAGIIDPGETAEACARREALEELGVRLGSLEPLARAFSGPGSCSETMSLYLAPYAAEDRIAAGGGLAEENEQIQVLELPLMELARQSDKGELRDLKTLTLILALRLRRPNLFT